MDASLRHLRQLLARPAAVFDAHATMAAVEHLADIARERGSDKASRYAIILRQTHPLLASPALQPLLLKLVGSEEEVAIAKEIQKALKSQCPASRFSDASRPLLAPYPFGQRNANIYCYTCGRRGHIARECLSRQRRGRQGRDYSS